MIEDGDQKYFTIPASPTTGILYITENNPEFISGQIRVRGREKGSYPFNYLEMIDAVFGKEDNTIEVCSGMIRKYRSTSCYTAEPCPYTCVCCHCVVSSASNPKCAHKIIEGIICTTN